MNYRQNLDAVNQLIEQHKTVPEVQLIAITKYLNEQQIEQAVRDGIYIFGENRLQQAAPKIERLKNNSEISWHFVGHIQKNKAKKIARYFSFIHSIDSWETLAAINKEAQKLDKKPSVLLQVNIAEEEQKQGFSPEVLRKSIERLSEFQHINFKGYMTMAPFVQDAELTRPVFKQLKQFADELKSRGVPYEHLSMGMSNDFIVALEEGATMVRLGTILFIKED